ncbi:hypothetical protein Cgig2_011163 [Carnegiea gigantea]|uniref:Uncharacterized protein n=1 Tax=Carnegiea gigantea TaxID=171969 RepID=A0A9Q1KEP2_9CARY|nr:hypothetical protein Cgig2_011163 [Carnegiea gigantea]
MRQPGQAAAPPRGRWPSPPLPPLPMRLTPGKPPGLKNKSKLLSLEGRPRSGHTTTECRKLKKALHELADKGQIDRFLKRGPQNRSPHSPSRGMKSVQRKSWPLLLQVMWRVLMTKQGPHVMVPTMVFGGKEVPRFASLHNDPLVVEIKIASVIVQTILVDTGSSVDIITWDCLKRLTHPG